MVKIVGRSLNLVNVHVHAMPFMPLLSIYFTILFTL